MIIRSAKPNDAAAMLDIYRPFIENTATSFETVVPGIDEFANRVKLYTQKYPWLIAEVDHQIAGYAYAAKHREREAYQWCVETSVYVHPAYYRRGIAAKLYGVLFSILKEMGFINVYAGIALPNNASVALHENSGFTRIGVYENIGYKIDAWHSVLWMIKPINPHINSPAPPKSILQIQQALPLYL